ncbi:MAG: energy-coupling factor transporter transmembrane protein EcfT [Desulfovibrio sp.]|nr:energy-coupling factor transporter transmembrane protein EcfT [Desulfovibrio sp.]
MKLSAFDPRIRLSLAALAALCLALVQQISSGLLGLALGLGLLRLARPPAARLLRRLAAVNVFVLFLWCVLPFTMPGGHISLEGLAASPTGLRLALLITLKANAIFCVFLALAGDMPPSAAGCALERLGCPVKLIFLFLVTGRYVHLFMEEWQILMDAAKLRGFAPRAGLRSWRVLACLLGLLLVRGYDRSRRACEAMRLRAFTGNFRTVTLFETRPADTALALVVLLFLAGIALAETGIIHV